MEKKQPKITTILKRYLNSEKCDQKVVEKLDSMIKEYKHGEKDRKIKKINKAIAKLEKERQQLEAE